ncbi:amidase [Solicola sp. PLA-1-18]|uniref:amidase n=1 Tax=Solicola sp. PLA-1-18 TaxID=3380532 RepID=UPI003B7E1FCC
MADLHELDAHALAAAYRRGDTTPTEVVDHLLERVGRLDAAVGAFVTVTADDARRRAAEATAAFAGDHDDLAPLLGVPTAIKDLNLTAGVRTTFGSAVMRDHVPRFSDAVVTNLEAAGLISLGKTNTPEFGSPCYTEPDVAPPARTPYDLTRSAGGSSGGAGAAVAAGLVPLAHGSDGGGSIRIPASVCGLVGLKPSRGRISRAPVYGDVTGLSTSGSLARTVRDAAVLLDVMAARVPGEALRAAPTPDGASWRAWCDRDPGRLRIARFVAPVIADVEVDAQVVAAWEEASRLLEGLGHELVDVDPPLAPTTVPAFETVWAVSATMSPVPPEAETQLRPLSRWLRERGRAASATDLAQALLAMGQAGARAVAAMDPFDAVLTPTLGQLPAPVGGIRDDADPEADFAAQKAFTPYTAAWNVTGMPAVSLPTAWSTEGLPIGTMLAGRPGEEHVLCALAAQVEDACSTTPGDWSRPAMSLP